MADTKKARRHKLDKMVFDEISFVDRGMNPHAEVLFWKRDVDDNDLYLLTDEELTALGKAFHLPGQASSAADCPEGWTFDATNKQCVRKQVGEDDQRDGETPAQRRRRLREERRLGPRSRQASQTGFLPTGRQLLQQRAHRDDCICRRCVKVGVAKRDVAKQLRVTLQEQESGGASPHTHTVEFPSGSVGPGTWESSEQQGHTHQIIVPDTVEPGDTRTLVSEIAVPEPPEGVEQHTHAVVIEPETSTANPPREDMQVSQRDLAAVYQEALDALRLLMGKEPSEEMRKQLFDDVRAKASREDAFHVLQSRIEDLSKSVFDILFLAEDEDVDPQAMLNETMAQFLDATSGELSDILSGRIVKEFGKLDVPPDPDEFRDTLSDFIEQSQVELAGEEQEEKGMDLSKLTPEDRAVVEKALEQAGLVEQLNKSLEDAKTKISELEKSVAEHSAGSGEEDDVTKGLPPAAAEFVKGLQTKNDLLSKQVNEMADFSKKAVLREQIISKLDSLAVGTDLVMDALWGIEDEEKRAAVLKILEAANVAVQKAGAFGSLGSDAQTGITSAAAKFDALAEEIVKNNPSTTMVEARAKAITDNPELYDEYMAEAEPNRYAAHRSH